MTYQCPGCGRPLDSFREQYRATVKIERTAKAAVSIEARKEARRAWEREYRRRRYHAEPELRARILERVRRYEQARRAG